ncbi:hypothetical protein JK358_37250 [Nocardia sp. 2]|uniref:Uncharacterized protein n=1 Tax=Nocardia acididurans TaxID=2802282 RepID=A0ABS1MIC4_9NOCA|nr:hypothetical protein [Nocardia acididurans]MBL1080059.1 hypothetical protein [Nocardia acididurans]
MGAGALLLTGLGILAYNVLGGSTGPLPLGVITLAIAWMVAAGSFEEWRRHRPRIEQLPGPVLVLRGHRWTVAHDIFGGLLLMGIAVSWRAVAIGDGEMLLYGATMAGMVVLSAPFFPRLQRSRLSLSPKGLRIATQRCDWEIPWSALDCVAPSRVAVGQYQPSPALALHCPRTALRARPLPGDPRAPRDWLPPRGTDGPWRVPAWVFGVDPSALLSTLIHLRDNPAHRATLTGRQLAAMLTPPPHEARWAASRQLADLIAATPPPDPPQVLRSRPTRRKALTRNRSRTRAGLLGVALAVALAAVLRSRR